MHEARRWEGGWREAEGSEEKVDDLQRNAILRVWKYERKIYKLK